MRRRKELGKNENITDEQSTSDFPMLGIPEGKQCKSSDWN